MPVPAWHLLTHRQNFKRESPLKNDKNTIFKDVGEKTEIQTYLFEMQGNLLLSACFLVHLMTSTQAVSDL